MLRSMRFSGLLIMIHPTHSPCQATYHVFIILPIEDSSIGTPLNKAASKTLKHQGMQSNVPYSIKKDADLNEAVKVGLKACDDM